MTAAELKASILDRAVRGLLVPQDPAEGSAAVINSDSSEATLTLRRTRKTRNVSGASDKSELMKRPSVDNPPYDLPPGWVWKQLNGLGTFHGGHTPSMDDRSLWGGNILWVSSKDMKTLELVTTEDKITEKAAAALEIVKPNSLIMVTRSGVLKHTFPIAIVKQPCTINQDIKAFIPNNTEITEYLAWCLRGLQPYILKHYRKNGTTVQSIVWNEFIKMPIPLPPLAEQRRIVAKIEELMPLVEEYGKTETELAALNDNFPTALKKSILQHAVEGKLTTTWREAVPCDETAADLLGKIAAEKKQLLAAGKIKKSKPLPPITDDEKPFPIPEGWAWVRLGEISSKIGAGATPKGGANVYVSHGVKLLREQNIHDDGLHLDNVVYITKETNDAKPGSQVQPKDILVNITGASIGRNSLVPDDFDTANVNQHVLIVRLIKRELRFYIHECLRSPLMLNLMYGKQTGDKPGLSAEKVMAFPIPLPPLEEQREIVARVEELLELVNEMKQP